MVNCACAFSQSESGKYFLMNNNWRLLNSAEELCRSIKEAVVHQGLKTKGDNSLITE